MDDNVENCLGSMYQLGLPKKPYKDWWYNLKKILASPGCMFTHLELLSDSSFESHPVLTSLLMLHFLKQLFKIYSPRSTITSRQQVKDYIEKSQKAFQEQLLKQKQQKQQRIQELQQGLRQQQHIDPQIREQLITELKRLKQQVKNYIEKSKKAVQLLLKQKQQRIKELQQILRQQQPIDPQTRERLIKELEQLQQQRKIVSGTTKPSPKAW